MRALIIVISILVVIATALTIVTGTRSFEGIVVEKPYETGLSWDADRARLARLGWTVTLAEGAHRLGRNDLVLNIVDKSGALLADASVSVKLTRPSTSAYDRTYPAVRKPDSTYLASIDFPLQGNWDLIIAVKRGADSAAFPLTVLITDSSTSSASAQKACDIQHGPCKAILADSSVLEFDIQPRPVRPMTELIFMTALSRNGKPVEGASMELDLSMPGMIMGKNRLILRPSSNGRHTGTGVIVRCSTNSKTWKAALNATIDGKNYPADFVFEVQ